MKTNVRKSFIILATMLGAGLFGTVSSAATPGYPETVVQWTVTNGETCRDISRALYGSPAHVDLLQRYNAVQCTPGGHLKNGTTLVVPEKVNYPPKARIQSMKSPVRARPAGGSWSPALRGMPLRERSNVNTLQKARADIRFLDRTHVYLAQNTLVVIYGTASHTHVTHQSPAKVKLDAGEVQAGIAALRGKPIVIDVDGGGQVQASSRDAVLRRKAKRTTVSVFDGKVNIQSAGKRVTVPEKMGSSFIDHKPPTPPRPLPPAPTWTDDSTGGVQLITKDHNEFTVSWKPVPRASSYRVELARDAAFGDLVARQEVPARILSFRAEKLEPGRYFVRVRTIDDEDFLGLTPPPLDITTVETDFAGGAAPDRGANVLHVSPYGVLTLRGAKGQQLAIDDGPFGPMPEAIDLGKLHPNQIRFRASDGATATTWKIAYETPSAVVSATPRSDGKTLEVHFVIHGIPMNSSAFGDVQVRVKQGEHTQTTRLEQLGRPTPASPGLVATFAGLDRDERPVDVQIIGPDGQQLSSSRISLQPTVLETPREPRWAGVSIPVYALSAWAATPWWTPRARTGASFAVASSSGVNGWTGQVRRSVAGDLGAVDIDASVPTPGFGDDRAQTDDAGWLGARIATQLDNEGTAWVGPSLRLAIPLQHTGSTYRVEAGFAASWIRGRWSLVGDIGARRALKEAAGPAAMPDLHGFALVGGTYEIVPEFRGYAVLDGQALHVERIYPRGGLSTGIEVGGRVFGSAGVRLSPWQDGGGFITGQLAFGARL